MPFPSLGVLWHTFDVELAVIFFWSFVALLASVAVSFLILQIFPKLGLLDRPEKFGLSRRPIPLPGGVGLVLVFLLFLALNHFWAPGVFQDAALLAHFQKQIWGLALAILLLATICFFDDRVGLSVILRLAGQVLAALILIAFGVGIEAISNPFGVAFDLTGFEIDFLKIGGNWHQINPVADSITIIWVVLLVNVSNWLDGVRGLTAGVNFAGGIVLGILALSESVGQGEIAILSFVFAFCVLGFLPFNLPPARMLLGDTGAMPMGLILAVLAILSGGKLATAFLVFALPIFDAVWVFFWRLKQGRLPWQGRDKAHLHDRLLERNFSEKFIFLIFFSFSSLLGLSALWLHTLGKVVLVGIFGILFLIFRWSLDWSFSR